MAERQLAEFKRVGMNWREIGGGWNMRMLWTKSGSHGKWSKEPSTRMQCFPKNQTGLPPV